MRRLILHTPGVHTGGGFVLLKVLLTASCLPLLALNLDLRIRDQIVVPSNAKVNWFAPSFWGRFCAEIRLRRQACDSDVVFCFHGFPPMFANAGRVVVFIQNRLNLQPGSGFEHGKLQIRATIKHLLFLLLSRNADEYIVQTPSMRKAVLECLGNSTPVKVVPFLDNIVYKFGANATAQKKYDFIYVADGVNHKNHRSLLEAWIILAQEGIRPSLMLTLGNRDKELVDKIEAVTKDYSLRIHNAGSVSRKDVFGLYHESRALIFPSKVESFGIPLIEAAYFELPIIASELDYVRDVCIPEETFDPESPISIARAVKRFLAVPWQPERLRSADEFFNELLDCQS